MRHLAAGLLLLLAALPAAAQPAALRVAIYSGTGAESDKLLALYTAVAAAGHTPLAVLPEDLVAGRLSAPTFDLFILPAGENGEACCLGRYADAAALGGTPAMDAIRAFLNSGGGVVALEAGARYASRNGGALDLYDADYHPVPDQIGKHTVTVTDPAFGPGALESWHSAGGGWFGVTATAQVIATGASGQPVIVRDTYGPGRVVLTSLGLELRGDTHLDWTFWDNVAMGSHAESEKNWVLLGRMLGWAYDGDASAPAIAPDPLPGGGRVAVVSSHTVDGGAWPGLLPAVGRAIEYAGHTPLAIRFDDIAAGGLVARDFDAVFFPGGYAYGYKTGLAGHEQKIRDFISGGGGYMGVCAGGFYAPGSIQWEGVTYPYPLNLYAGQAIGALSDIAAWPDYALTPTRVEDPVAGGTYSLQQTYYGGGHFTIPGGTAVTPAVTYDYGGQFHGTNNIVRYRYGAGNVVLSGTHPESRAGSDEDWVFWDAYDAAGNPLANPDNPWILYDRYFDDWLLGTTATSSPASASASGVVLGPPAPNPARGSVRIPVWTDGLHPVRISLHDVRGGRVSTLVPELSGEGPHSVAWNGLDDRSRPVPDGVYFLRLTSGPVTATRRLVVRR